MISPPSESQPGSASHHPSVRPLSNSPSTSKFIEWWPFAIISIFFWAPILVVIIKGYTPAGNDESLYHLPAILQIAKKWPALDLAKDCLSASAPGYHWLLAGVAKLTNGNLFILRLVNALISYLLIVILYQWLRRSFRSLDAAILVMPLAWSKYIIGTSAWIFTDNAGLLLVTLTLLILVTPFNNPRSPWVAGLLSAATLMVRQIHGWTLAPVIVRLLSSSERRTFNTVAYRSFPALAPPAIVLALFYWYWHGLIPPAWKTAAVGVSFCSQCYALTVFLMFGIFYLFPFLNPAFFRNALTLPKLLSLLVLGIVIAVAGPTSYDDQNGRWGGYLWSIISHCPAPAGRSMFFLVTVPASLWLGSVWWSSAKSNNAPAGNAVLLGVAAIAWLGSLVVVKLVFQRYFEPTILVFLILSSGLFLRPDRITTAMRTCLIGCGMFQLVATGATFWALLCR